MCGIAGFLRAHPDPFGETVLARMLDVLSHRGPDDQGFHITSVQGMPATQVGLGHRRLKIIDLSERAHQPMGNEAGTVWLTYNGEVYNFPDLRRELEGQGYRFRSDSDTEVLLRLYEAEGEGCFSRLNGMFACAIWDARRRMLVLARDRYGIKPLYYWCHQDGCVFASELKALLEFPGAPRELDRHALDEYLTWLCVPAPRTILRGISKLLPGHLLRVQHGDANLVRYARPPADGGRPFRSESEAAEAVRGALQNAVKRQLVADVPVGVFLSGGIDSSILALEADASGYRPLQTFSVGFAEDDYDERPFAAQLAAVLGTRHHDWVWSLRDEATLRRIAWHLDEPFGDASALANYGLAELAARDVRVALSGAGGDELFGGYQQYQAARWMRLYDRCVPVGLRRRIAASCGRFTSLDRTPGWPRRLRRILCAGDLPPVERHQHYMTQLSFSPAEKAQLYQPDMCAATVSAQAQAASDGVAWRSGGDLLAQLMELDRMGYLPNDILTLTDRMSMAHSLEIRVPFLDEEVIEVAARIPSTWKVGFGSTKRVLRRAYASALPPGLVRRRKHGFGVPVGSWLRTFGSSWLDDCLGAGVGIREGLFDAAYVRRLIAEHYSGARDHGTRLWLLVMLELWAQQMLEAPFAAVP